MIQPGCSLLSRVLAIERSPYVSWFLLEMVALTCNFSMQKLEAEMLDLKVSLGYRVRPCLKNGSNVTATGQGVEELDLEPVFCDLSFKPFLLPNLLGPVGSR